MAVVARRPCKAMDGYEEYFDAKLVMRSCYRCEVELKLVLSILHSASYEESLSVGRGGVVSCIRIERELWEKAMEGNTTRQ